jgi:hypothetical protein
MFDKAQIMRMAWAKYREFRQRYAPWQIERGVVDASFSNCLKIAWRTAKREAAEAAATVAALALWSSKAADRARELNAELMRMDCQPWGMRSYHIAAARAALQGELTTLRV